MFILGTDSILAVVRPEDVDPVGPIPQVLSMGLLRLGVAGPISAFVILLLAGRQIGPSALASRGGLHQAADGCGLGSFIYLSGSDASIVYIALQ